MSEEKFANAVIAALLVFVVGLVIPLIFGIWSNHDIEVRKIESGCCRECEVKS